MKVLKKYFLFICLIVESKADLLLLREKILINLKKKKFNSEYHFGTIKWLKG